MVAAINDAQRLLDVMRGVVDNGTKSGANVEITYGQVESVTGREASVYLAGSQLLATSDGGTPEPSENFRIPAHLTVSANDFVRVSLDSRGHRWIDEVIPQTTYPKLSVDPTGGRILLGEGDFTPVVGGAGQILAMDDYGDKLTWATPTDLMVIPFAMQSPAASLTNAEVPLFDAANPSSQPRLALPFDFDVVGVSVRLSTVRTAGTLSATPRIGSTPTSITATIDGTNTQTAYETGAANLTQNRATTGSQVGLVVSTSADWAPTTAYLYGGIFVMARKFRPKVTTTSVLATLTANAVLLKPSNYSFIANSVLRKNVANTFTADAALIVAGSSVTRSGTFFANSVLAGNVTYTQTVYVATAAGGGSDSNSGTFASPYLTIAKGINSVAVGGRVIVRGGTYSNFFVTGKSTITIENYPDEDVIIQRTTTGTVANLENCQNMVIRGGVGLGSLKIRSTIANLTGSSTGIQLIYNSGVGGFTNVNNTVDSVIVEDIAGYGIQCQGGSGHTIVGTEVWHCGTGIRFFQHSNFVVTDCTIHDMNRMIVNDATSNNDNGATGIALDNDCNNGLIRRNNIYKCSAPSTDYGYDGGAVEIYQSHDNTIEYNICWDNEGGIETGTQNRTTYPTNNNIVRYNQFYGKGNNNGASPLLLLRAAKGMQVYHNVIDLDTGNDVFRVQEGTGTWDGDLDNLKIKNNVVRVASANKVYALNKVSFTAPGVEIDYNVIYNTTAGATIADSGVQSYAQTNIAGWRSATTYSDHDVWGVDPQFQDRLARDYHPTSASPMVNAGVYISGTNDGYVGTAPDVGMFEYNPPYLINDTFTRTVTASFGTPDTGPTYVTSGGVSGDYNVNGSSGTITHTAANTPHFAYIQTAKQDQTALMRVAVNKLPTGTNVAIVNGPVHRIIDAGNHYRCEFKWLASGATQLGFRAAVAFASSQVGTQLDLSLTATGSATEFFWIRTEAVGINPTTLRAKVWKDGTAEPVSWTLEVTDSTATNLQAAAGVGIRSGTTTGVTNTPIVCYFSDFTSDA